MHASIRRTLSWLLVSVPLLLIASCTSSTRALQRGPSAGVQVAAPATAPAGEPSEIARWAYTRCGTRSPSAKRECYEQVLADAVPSAGAAVALQVVVHLAALDRLVKRDSHVYACGIGLAALTPEADVAETFAQCIPVLDAGCYHGVIQAYFARLRQSGDTTLSAAVVAAPCQEHRGEDGSRWLLGQCVHGLGHGLVIFYAYELPQALEACDLLESAWDRESCYSGAFMENIVNATMPRHPASVAAHRTPDSADPSHHHAHAHDAQEHPAAAPAAAAGATRFQALDSRDLLYPCSAVDERYWAACYGIQTAAILFHTRGSLRRAAEACNGAPEKMRPICYESLGRDAIAYARYRPAAALRLCRVGDPRYQPWCHVGVAKQFVNLSARAEAGMSYCRDVPGSPGKQRCYEAVGMQIALLAQEPESRQALCSLAEDEYIEVCRYAAGIADQRP